MTEISRPFICRHTELDIFTGDSALAIVISTDKVIALEKKWTN